MPLSDLVARPLLQLDSLPQSCGLSLPIFTHERIGAMPTCASRVAENAECLEFLAGNRGLSLLTLFRRIGTTGVNGRRAVGSCDENRGVPGPGPCA